MARKSDSAEVEWKILHEIENSDNTTQRTLSKDLNLALGAINFHLKRLVNKGFIKMKTLPPNRAIYFVTPRGISRKVRLTYEYMVGTLAFYRESRRRSLELFQNLEKEGVKTVAFLGARDLAEICFLSLQETNLALEGIYDDKRSGNNFLGYTVKSEEHLNKSAIDKIIFTKQDWSKRGEYEGRKDMVFIF